MTFAQGAAMMRGALPVGMVCEREAGGGAPGLRADAFVDGVAYEDTGCEYHSRCLTCPFERCLYETAHRGVSVAVRAKATARRERIVALRDPGLDATAIATEIGVSRRTVFRALAG